MGTVRKTITLTDKQDDWIKAQIDAGHYTNDSECVRDLIRREQERSAELEAIRAALIEGEIQWGAASVRCPSVQAENVSAAWLSFASRLPLSTTSSQSGVTPFNGGASNKQTATQTS